MPSLRMSFRNPSSTDLKAPAVPALARAASPRAPARSAVPANVVRRCVANIGLLDDVVLFRLLSGPISESDRCLGGFLKDSWRPRRQPCDGFRRGASAVFEPPFVQ